MIDLVVLNLAYVALVGATFTRTLDRLRGLLICGAICFVLYGLAADVASIVLWNIAIGGLHTFRAVRDALARRSVTLADDERRVRDELLPAVSDYDFYLLWSMGAERTYDNTTVIARGSVPDTVRLILGGAVRIEGDAVAKILRRGALLGEMSFVSGDAAIVDAVAVDLVTVREWEQRDLTALAQSHPPSAQAFQRLLERDLVAKTRV